MEPNSITKTQIHESILSVELKSILGCYTDLLALLISIWICILAYLLFAVLLTILLMYLLMYLLIF